MSHKEPIDGSSCMCCWDDISSTNYVEYTTTSDTNEEIWQPSGYCSSCIEVLLQSQWKNYITGLEKATCRAEMRRLLEKGPPIYISDSKALPCPENSDVKSLWFKVDGSIKSSKLEGALEGQERLDFWNEKMNFFPDNENDDEEK
eukprot:gene19634-25545_t